MIALDVKQGSLEWVEARLKIPTASQFGRIITPAKLGYSAGAAGYIAELLAEWVTGFPVDKGSTRAMDRGTGMEDEARAWYEMQNDCEVELAGFLLSEDRRCGGSPDGFVGEDGGVDFKCPLIHTHIAYLLAPGSLADGYRAQMQGYLYITGRAWWDIVSYHPTLPKVQERIERDADFQAALEKHIGRFLAELEEGRQKLVEMGVKPAPSFRRQADPRAWDEAAASVRSSEEVVRGMYDPRPATEGEIGALKILRTRVDSLSVDEQMSLADTIRSGDGHAVQLWTRKLERLTGRPA